MKKEKQARRQNSATESSNQTSNPARHPSPTAGEFTKGIKAAIAVLDSQLSGNDQEDLDRFLLSVRQHLSPLVDPSAPKIPAQGANQPPLHDHVSDGVRSRIQKVNQLILDLLQEIDSKMQEDHSSDVKIEFLTIRQAVEEVQCEAGCLTIEAFKNPAPTQSGPEHLATSVPPLGVDPFPVHEDPMDVQGPRFHIRDFYEMIEKEKHEDGLASLVGLRDCIEHHPGLEVEAKALQMLVDGSNALNSLACRHACAKESASGFAGAEVWLVNLLDKVDESVTVKDYLWELRGVPAKLRGNPATNDLANAVDGMFQGQNVMRKLNLWLKSM